MTNNAYVLAFTSALRRMVYSPSQIIVNALFYAALVTVYAALWRAVMNAAGGSINGYDHTAITCYFAGAEAAVAATRQPLIQDIGNDIVEKKVEAEMLRPASMFGLRFANEMGESVARAALLLPVGLVITWLLSDGLPSLASGLLVPLAVVLAIACNVALQHALGAVAFWLRDAKAGWFIYQKGVFLLGAMLLPIQMLAPVLQTIVWMLPFWTMAYVPARFAAGYFEPALMLGQVAWLVVLVALASHVFARGERRLQRTGA